jgi:hypothetical protein
MPRNASIANRRRMRLRVRRAEQGKSQQGCCGLVRSRMVYCTSNLGIHWSLKDLRLGSGHRLPSGIWSAGRAVQLPRGLLKGNPGRVGSTSAIVVC